MKNAGFDVLFLQLDTMTDLCWYMLTFNLVKYCNAVFY